MSEVVEKFIAMVETNQHIAAIEQFYADNATIQDNQSAEIRDKNKQIANEKRLLMTVNKMYSHCIRPYFVADNCVAIKWNFRFEFKNNTFIDIEEVAWQKWENGKIITEQFFFAPKQFVPKPLDQA